MLLDRRVTAAFTVYRKNRHCPILIVLTVADNKVQVIERANVLMVSHAIKEASSGQRIKVISDDTHVLVLLAHRSFNNTKGMAEVESFTIDSTDSSATVSTSKRSPKYMLPLCQIYQQPTI